MDQASTLVEVLEEARSRGFLGPEPVEHHIEHSRHLAEAVGPCRGSFLDLGSGGGVPGLVLATCWPAAQGVLLESQQRRGEFLAEAVAQLDVAGRVGVRVGRAEDLARDPDLRGRIDLVVARAFGRPAVTAECGVGFLAAGGRLVVTEPPEGTSELLERWPPDRLRELGLGPATAHRSSGAGVVVLVASGEPRERWPRRVGRPSKSPLW